MRTPTSTEGLLEFACLQREVETRLQVRHKGQPATAYTVQVIRLLVARGHGTFAEALGTEQVDIIRDAERKGISAATCAELLLSL